MDDSYQLTAQSLACGCFIEGWSAGVVRTSRARRAPGTGDVDREEIFSVFRADRLLLQLGAESEGQLCPGDHTGDVGQHPGDVGVLLSGNLYAVL